MILMPQIFDVTANENARYKRDELECSVYFYKGAHEYPVLDRRPGSNDLQLDFRWVCAVSCARIWESRMTSSSRLEDISRGWHALT